MKEAELVSSICQDDSQTTGGSGGGFSILAVKDESGFRGGVTSEHCKGCVRTFVLIVVLPSRASIRRRDELYFGLADSGVRKVS